MLSGHVCYTAKLHRFIYYENSMSERDTVWWRMQSAFFACPQFIEISKELEVKFIAENLEERAEK